MDVNTTCEFLGIKYATFSDNYRYLKGFPKELPGKKWSKRAIKEWLSNQNIITFTKRTSGQGLRQKLFDYIIAQKRG